MHIFATSFQAITVQSNCYANFPLIKGQYEEWEVSFFFAHFPSRGYSYMFTMSHEEEEPSARTDQETRFSSLEAKLDAWSSSFEALARKFDAWPSARPNVSQNSDLEEDFLPAENDDVFDSAESVLSHKGQTADLSYEDLCKDCEDCGPKFYDGVAKRVDVACTKKPAKEQLSKIQAKYLRPRNCEYFKVPRVNPELWDDLLDTVKSRDVGFQAFQKGLIKGIVPVASLASKLEWLLKV